jgi:hypothetical protein
MGNNITNETLLNAIISVGENQQKLRNSFSMILKRIDNISEDVTNIKQELSILRTNTINWTYTENSHPDCYPVIAQKMNGKYTIINEDFNTASNRYQLFRWSYIN